jgi:hypothetical protein
VSISNVGPYSMATTPDRHQSWRGVLEQSSPRLFDRRVAALPARRRDTYSGEGRAGQVSGGHAVGSTRRQMTGSFAASAASGGRTRRQLASAAQLRRSSHHYLPSALERRVRHGRRRFHVWPATAHTVADGEGPAIPYQGPSAHYPPRIPAAPLAPVPVKPGRCHHRCRRRRRCAHRRTR